VAALTHVLQDTKPQEFRALVPEAAMREGFNRVDVFTIEGAGKRAKLAWIGSSAPQS
jgi:hypothetical protein